MSAMEQQNSVASRRKKDPAVANSGGQSPNKRYGYDRQEVYKMAWRSSGSTNDEMVTNLKRFGVISSESVEEGFRAVDRRLFVPRNQRNLAHMDQPLKEGNIHISAPHIYGSIVEALELSPNSCTSFLNIGSGTGYLSCVVAHILGPASTHYAVDIHADVIAHSRRAIRAWKNSRPDDSFPQMEVLQGNGLCINHNQGEAAVGLDRIYLGAAVEKRHLNQLVELLRPGGILVGPVGDELVKVFRTDRTSSSDQALGAVPRSLRGHPPLLSRDFTQQIISSVRFSELLESPQVEVLLPTRVWSPDRHRLYPTSFRMATKEILLCSRAQEIQPPPIVVEEQVNVASKLPGFLWMEILSYSRRDWFERPVSERDLLERRLREEQAQNQRHQERLVEMEARLRIAEREREGFRIMALRWQKRLLQRASNEEDADVSMSDEDMLDGIDSTMDVPIGHMFQHLVRVHRATQYGAASESDSDEDESSESDDEVEMEDASAMSSESVTNHALHQSNHTSRVQARSVSIGDGEA